jgi:hypothetical protein
LVRTELSEKVAKAANAVGLLFGAIILLFAGLFILLQGAVAWLVIAGMQPHWAAFLVGAGRHHWICFVLNRALRSQGLQPDT